MITRSVQKEKKRTHKKKKRGRKGVTWQGNGGMRNRKTVRKSGSGEGTNSQLNRKGDGENRKKGSRRSVGEDRKWGRNVSLQGGDQVERS